MSPVASPPGNVVVDIAGRPETASDRDNDGPDTTRSRRSGPDLWLSTVATQIDQRRSERAARLSRAQPRGSGALGASSYMWSWQASDSAAHVNATSAARRRSDR